MKKFLIVLFTLWSFSAAAAEKAYDRVIASNTIKCGYSISPPVLVKDPNTGKLSGMDVDLWDAIARRLDMKIEWVQGSGWGTFAEDLRQGRYDAFCSQIWMNPARTKYLSVTLPVSYTFLNAYVRPDDSRFGTDLSALNNPSVTIPVLDGDITEHMAKSGFPKAKRFSLSNNADWSELYLAVTTGKADVFFVDPTSFAAVSANNPIKLKKLNTPPVFTFGSRYSFASGEYALRDMVNVVLQSMIDDGSLETMAKATSSYITVPTKAYSKPEK